MHLARPDQADRPSVRTAAAWPAPQPRPKPVPRLDAAALREARERRGLSARRLEALAQLNPAHLSRLECGRRRLPAHVADRLEAALEQEPIRIDVDWRALRDRVDLLQREAAHRAGIHCAVLTPIERGKRRTTRDVVQRLAKTFGTTTMRR